MDRFNKITVPAGQKLRQLQKIVHDIKKNDSGIMSKFKKLTSKPPPSVPPVDYVPGPVDDDQWSDDFDSDYENPDDDHSDSETYVVPNDDNYESPPSERKKTIPSAFSYPRGDYIDDQHHQQQSRSIGKPLPTLPTQPLPTPKKLHTLPTPSAYPRPKILPKPKECTDEEADYVVPVDDEEDNYIEPTDESSPQPVKPPVVNRSIKPTSKLDLPGSSLLPPVPESSSMQDVYEIPEEDEEIASPTLPRISKPLPPKPVQRPGRHSDGPTTVKELPKPDVPRKILPVPRNQPPLKVDDGLQKQDDENLSSNGAHEFRVPSVAIPSPLPRFTRSQPIPALPSKPNLPDRDHLSTDDKPVPAERRRGSSHDIPLPPLPPSIQKPLPQKPPVLLRSPELPSSRTLGTSRNNSQSGLNTLEKDPGVHGKAWYMASSDRKTAEDALYKSNKDGSFLVRKSSGQDSKQPYTLVVLYNNRVYNIPIRFIESTRQYALGREKSGEERFNSVAEIIENHQQHSIVLIDTQNNTKDSTKLKHIIRVS